MDYSLAALKALCSQLKNAIEVPSQNGFTLGGILFQRAWLQGVLVSASDGGSLLLDDGTGLIELSLSGEFRLRPWRIGMYVMVVGGYIARTGEPPMIKVHKMVDLSSFPDREAMWYLEVLEDNGDVLSFPHIKLHIHSHLKAFLPRTGDKALDHSAQVVG